jgi:hypothetical protein
MSCTRSFARKYVLARYPTATCKREDTFKVVYQVRLRRDDTTPIASAFSPRSAWFEAYYKLKDE